MCAAHLQGDGATAGSFTSGGTESIILAVKAARDRARALRGHLDPPEMVLPVTAHAAFQKAGHYLGVRPVMVPVDERTCAADPARMREAITDRTILLVGSAPSYGHGVVDPITELGAIALERDLWFHVDACIGGFLLPYLRRLGAPIPDFDLSVPGVSSISMDLHKYAFCPKGASVVLYRERALRRHQIYACARWTGYGVVNTTIQSSKSGAPLAAAWAVLRSLGDEGYLSLARRMLDGTRQLVAGLEAIEDVRIVGRPDMTLVAFSSDAPLFRLADELNTGGWLVQEQLAYGGLPATIHLMVTPGNAGRIDGLLEALRQGLASARQAGAGELAALARQALTGVDAASLTPEMIGQLLGMAGLREGGIPERMADINELLDSLPRELCEALLVEFVNRLY
jgi:glutamate/tyrosine decarboxylase-like PLP-dependent enzyme